MDIKEIRKSKGLTQRELASKSGVSFSMISKLESGEKTNPSYDTLTKIAAALDVDTSSLLGQTMLDKDTSKEYLLEQLINKMGYSLISDYSEGILGIKYKGAEYEISLDDLDHIYTSSASFIEFQLQDLINRSRKIGH